MTPEQCRMARAGLGLGVRDLAKLADVSTNTITRLERGGELYARTIQAIRQALETAGVEFISENGGGPGVRLAGKPQPIPNQGDLHAPVDGLPIPGGNTMLPNSAP